jgi:hypothetical protein
MNSEFQNIKKYEEEIRTLLEELGLDQIEFEFTDFRSHDRHLEIDLEFDDEAV